MARASNTEQRRTQIAEALLTVMAKRGYEGASIVAIAKQARLAPGLVHYHFRNKLEILLEAVGVLADRHLAILDAALAAAVAAPAAQLVAFVDVHLGLGAHADPTALACWVLIGGEALRERRLQVAYERALTALSARLGAIIERGVADRSFARVDPVACAAAVVAVIQGYFVVAASARAVVPSGTAATCALRMAEGLLRPAHPLAVDPAGTARRATSRAVPAEREPTSPITRRRP
ncbi:MAG: TetR/AcrR family transcriptional regulator [Kofleriaceae bacterium]